MTSDPFLHLVQAPEGLEAGVTQKKGRLLLVLRKSGGTWTACYQFKSGTSLVQAKQEAPDLIGLFQVLATELS